MNEGELLARFDAVVKDVEERFWNRSQDPGAALDVRRSERKIRRVIAEDRGGGGPTYFAYTVAVEQLERMAPRAIANDFMTSSDAALAEEQREIEREGR